MTNLRIISFGYGHAPAPKADLTFDARDHFRDPHVSSALREATGRDPEVIKHVLDTDGVLVFIDSAVIALETLLVTSSKPLLVFAVGCVGGRHRSVVISDQAAVLLRHLGYTVEVEHRDVDKPVLQR